MIKNISAEWVRAWLKGRDRKKLYPCANQMLRRFGFIDVCNADYVFFSISECMKDRGLYTLHKKLSKNSLPESDMLKDWIHAISQDG